MLFIFLFTFEFWQGIKRLVSKKFEFLKKLIIWWKKWYYIRNYKFFKDQFFITTFICITYLIKSLNCPILRYILHIYIKLLLIFKYTQFVSKLFIDKQCTFYFYTTNICKCNFSPNNPQFRIKIKCNNQFFNLVANFHHMV